jgi:LuxR family maltose regulon positive regulatory protein
VRRRRIVDQLLGSRQFPVVTVLAGPGYGKTTLVGQWAEADERPTAWVSLDHRDNDPRVFLTYVALALQGAQPIPAAFFDALTANAPVETVLIPRRASALSLSTAPRLLVLDDVQLLREPTCLDAITALISHLPSGSQLALVGRDESELPVARLRARGQAVGIGPGELAFDAHETDLLVRNTGVGLPTHAIADLVEQTEGWPLGLYVALMSVETAADSALTTRIRGDDALLADYFRTEILDRQPPAVARFLTRSAVLEEMSGPLCDWVLETQGSAVTLESLASENQLIVALDRRHEWYRYHHLFRDLLRFDLEQREASVASELRRRAATWYEDQGRLEEAIEFAQVAGDADTAARLFCMICVDMWRSGRVPTVRRWIDWFDRQDRISRHPSVALFGALVLGNAGEPERALRMVAVADPNASVEVLPDGETPAAALAAIVHCLMCRGGIEQMRRDASQAVLLTPESSMLRGFALAVSGAAHLLGGRDGEADVDLALAADVGQRTGFGSDVVAALACRASVAIERNDWPAATMFVAEGHAWTREHSVDDYLATALLTAVSARVALHEADHEAATEGLVRAQRLRPQLTFIFPWLSVLVRLELAHAYMALGDAAAVWTILREVDEIFRHRPDLGVLAQRKDEMRQRLVDMPVTTSGASTLTSAELRVLPMLATHLTMPEIASRLFVSRHTIKSQSASIYRKLGVSTRSDAVERARAIGLLDE